MQITLKYKDNFDEESDPTSILTLAETSSTAGSQGVDSLKAKPRYGEPPFMAGRLELSSPHIKKPCSG